MGPFIRLLLIVMIVKSQAELRVASSGSRKTVSCELETSSKIDELRSITENYLNMVNIELRNTNDQFDELQVTVSKNHELQIAVSENQDRVSSELGDTRRQVEELQVAVSANQETVSSELGDTRRQVEELQVAVSANQETVSSELEDTGRKVDELQVAFLSNQEFVTSELRNTSDQLTVTRREMGVIGRQVEDLQESVSALMKLLNGNVLFQWKPQDCSDLHARGVTRSGVYSITPLDSAEPFRVYCDMDTDGGGWTVFQRRQDGSVDFYLDFASYSRGFGNLEGEFWLGNDNLYRLTAQGHYELRVDLSDFENESRYATYDSFSIADGSDNYRLTLGSYSGTAGDSLSGHNNYQFSTKDRDNDAASSSNCAQTYHGAWWYDSCHQSNLNGEYLRGTTTECCRRVVWSDWNGYYYSLKTTEMKIRPTPQ